MQKLIALSLILFCSMSSADEEDMKKYQPDIFAVSTKVMGSRKDIKTLEDSLLQVSMEDIVSLGRSERELRKIRNDLLPLPKATRSQMQNPFPPYRALIKRGVRLFSLDLNEVFIARRDIVASTNEIVKGGNLSFVFNKSGEPQFIVISRNIEKIEEHLELESKLDATKTYKRDYRHKIQDYSFQIEHSLNFHIENMKAVFFAEISNADSTGARANRVEYRAFIPWQFPVHLGFSTSFQDGRYSNYENGAGIDWNAVYAGPYLRMTLDKSDDHRLLGYFGLEKSFYFDVAESFQLSTNLWSAIIESEWQIKGETITFGLGYRSMRGHIKKSIIGFIEKNSTRRKITSIDFSIGYRFGQIL